MATYDPNIIQKFADKLYAQANLTVFLYTIIGAVVGGGAGYMVDANSRDGGTYAIVGSIVAGLLGLAMGFQRSFMLRVQAQTALCQMKVEQNTRKS